MEFTEWTQPQMCPVGYAICGLRTQVERLLLSNVDDWQDVGNRRCGVQSKNNYKKMHKFSEKLVKIKFSIILKNGITFKPFLGDYTGLNNVEMICCELPNKERLSLIKFQAGNHGVEISI